MWCTNLSKFDQGKYYCPTLNHLLKYLAFELLTINWLKKTIDFVKIKFSLNENIEWHCMQLEFNSIQK
jgi:hypothetical protein